MNGSTIDPRLRAALDGVIDPELRRPVTELGMIPEAVLEGGTARVTVLLTVSGCPMRTTIEADLRAALNELPDVRDVAVDVGVMTPAQRQELQEKLGHHRTNPFADPHSLTRVHAITSGKGGVG